MNYEDIVKRLCRKIGYFDAMIEHGDRSTYNNEDVRNILEEILSETKTTMSA